MLMGRWLLVSLLFVYFSHRMRHTEIENFMQRSMAEHQQEYLNKIFDNQQDGVIILTAVTQEDTPTPIATLPDDSNAIGELSQSDSSFWNPSAPGA